MLSKIIILVNLKLILTKRMKKPKTLCQPLHRKADLIAALMQERGNNPCNNAICRKCPLDEHMGYSSCLPVSMGRKGQLLVVEKIKKVKVTPHFLNALTAKNLIRSIRFSLSL